METAKRRIARSDQPFRIRYKPSAKTVKSHCDYPVESLDNVSEPSLTRVFSSFGSAVKFIFAVVSFQEAGKCNRAQKLRNRVEPALALYKAGQYFEGTVEFQQLHDAARRELGDSHPTTLAIKHFIALGLEKSNNLEQAQSIYQEVLLFRQASNDPDTADTMHALARMNQRFGNLENAHDLYNEALKRRTSLLGWERTETLHIAEDLIEMLIIEQRDLPGAQRLCEEVLQRLPEHSKSIPTFVELQKKIAGMLLGCFLFQEALGLAKLKHGDGIINSDEDCGQSPHCEVLGTSEMAKALAYGEGELGMDHPDVISIVELLAESLQNVEDPCEREDLYVRAWITRTLEEGPYHPLTVHTVRRFRSYLVTLGRFQEAELMLNAALQGQSACTEHPDPQQGGTEAIAQCFRELYSLHALSEQERQTLVNQIHGSLDESSRHDHANAHTIADNTEWITTSTRTVGQLELILDRTVKKRERLLGPDDSKTLEAMRAVAIIRWAQKRDTPAELAMRAILRRCEHTLGKSHPQTLLSMCDLAITLSGSASNELIAEAQMFSQAALFGFEDRFGLHHHGTVACYNQLMNFGLTHWTFTKERRPPFIYVENVGSGGFSIVNSVERAANTAEASNKTYAQKIFRIPNDGRRDEYLRMIQNEIDVIRKLKHPHIIHIVCTYQELKNFAIILSPLADEDLESFLYRQNTDGSEPLDKDMITGWFYCLAKSLAYIHSHGVRHKDIKPRNILIKAGKLYFTDFGSSRIFASELTSSTEGYFIGGNTKMYSAPEVMNNARRSRSADIFSLGCVFTEMATILDGRRLTDYYDFRVRGEPDGYTGETHVYWKNLGKVDEWLEAPSQPSCYADIIKPMLSFDRNDRPRATETAEAVLRFYGNKIKCDDCCECDPILYT